jgi:hypothetical protein
MSMTEKERLAEAWNRNGMMSDEQARLETAFNRHVKDIEGGGSITAPKPTRDFSYGALAGSIAGGVAGGPLGAVGGAIVGEVGQQLYEKYVSGTPEKAPQSVDSAIGRVAEQGIFAAAGEAGAKAITFLRPVSYAQPRQLTPDQLRTKTFLDQHQIPYTLDQITGSPFHSFARSIADNGIFSAKNMTAFIGKQNEAIRASAVDIADTMGQHVPPNVLGRQILNTINTEDDTITSAVINPLYNRIAQDLSFTERTIQVPTGRQIPHPQGLMGANGQPLTIPELVDKTVTQGGLLIDQRPIKALFQQEVYELERTAARENSPDLLKSASYQSMKRYAALPDDGQWKDAHLILKETRASLRAMDNPLNVATEVLQDRAVLGRAEKVLESQLDTALRQSSDPAHQADLALWEQAQKAVKEKNVRLKNDIVLTFIKKLDEHGGEGGLKPFVSSMLPEDTLKVMEATRSAPDVQGSLRRSYLEDKIIRAGGMADANAPFNAEKFNKVLFGSDEMNARKSAILLDPRQQAKLKEFTNAVRDAQENGDTSGKFGSVFIKMTSAGAVFSAPYSAYQTLHGNSSGAWQLGAEVGILVGPKGLASLLTNPKATEYLIQGLKYSASNSQVGRIVRELTRLDQGFAQAVRAGLDAHFAEQEGGLFGDARIRGAAKTFEDTLPSQLLDRMQ